MKAPLNWLREYVDIDMDAEVYAGRMVMTGTGVEGVEDVAEFENVVVGRVLSCEAHENSDHLHVCMVDVGGEEALQIVCGAPNVAKGQLVPVALEGAKLPGGHVIRRGKLRGVQSRGMICSGPELNVPEALYPHVGDAGILVFREEHAPGTDARVALGLDGQVVDFEILANRPDLLSIWGLARETAAVLDEHCLMPEIAVEAAGARAFSELATVRVEDDQLCPRYCARVIDNVKIGPSPLWMRRHLHAAGVRPINNIVDITNYVMLETGHPMHAFDMDKVAGRTIVVRRARPGEALTTLDGKAHMLTGDMLVIADAERATGLAGIMGGEESEIAEGTKTVLFECAAFDRTGTRLTARALGIRTEASARFEKGVCADTAMEAIERACMLVNMLECGTVAPGAFDHYRNPAPARMIDASVRRINALISADLTGEQMEDLLARLDIDATCAGDELTAEPPARRGDIESEADLAEEILRLNGYEHIPSTLMQGRTCAGTRSEGQRFADRIKRALVGMGWFEAMSFSFISPRLVPLLNLPAGDKRLSPVKLRNPLGEDTSVMRTSLVPSMLQSLVVNMSRGAGEVKLFELAPVFEPTKPGELPRERKTLCLGLYGEDADFYALRDACVWMMQTIGRVPSFAPGGDGYYHPGRKAIASCAGEVIGQLGEIHPDVAAAFDAEGKRLYVMELDAERLMAAQRPIAEVQALPRFPAVSRDLALTTDEATPVGPLMEAIRRAAGAELEDIQLFDIYRGAQLGRGVKSAAFALTFRAADRTLTEAEINERVEKVLAAAQALGARLRG
ncbi:MAG: phenylalanine--tRNA ligase subunit beta [Eubacteriales bacterium]|nr:phenylalanine--tRNA ligase subunit beta [Christensenellaceae bacterium]MEA5065709.1 phenylalanine--tRNA ligase subunit beta [Eubacteriales bacterium]